MRAIDAARQALDPKLFLEVKYEDFCEQPLEHFRRVLDFAELPPSKELEDEVRSASIRSTSNRWRKDLTVGQQAILDNLLREDLLRYGYGDAKPQEVRQAVAR